MRQSSRDNALVNYLRLEYLQLIADVENNISQDLAAHLYSTYILRRRLPDLLPPGFSRWPLMPHDPTPLIENMDQETREKFALAIAQAAKLPRPMLSTTANSMKYVDELDFSPNPTTASSSSSDSSPISASRKRLVLELNACLQRTIYSRLQAEGRRVDIERVPQLSEGNIDKLFGCIDDILDNVIARTRRIDLFDRARVMPHRLARPEYHAYYRTDAAFDWKEIVYRYAIIGNVYTRCQRLFYDNTERPQESGDVEVLSITSAQNPNQDDENEENAETNKQQRSHDHEDVEQIDVDQESDPQLTITKRKPTAYEIRRSRKEIRKTKRILPRGIHPELSRNWQMTMSTQENPVETYGGGIFREGRTEESPLEMIWAIAEASMPVDDRSVTASDLAAMYGIEVDNNTPAEEAINESRRQSERRTDLVWKFRRLGMRPLLQSNSNE